MITKTYDIDMCPGGVPVVVHLSQYDNDFKLVFNLFSRTGDLSIASGTTAAIRGTKSDGNGFSANCAIDISKKQVTVIGDQQMTVVAGRQTFELTLYASSKELSTANFILDVKRAALDKDTPTSKSQTRELVEIEDNSAELIAAANDIKKTKSDFDADVVKTKTEINEIAKTVADNAGSANELAKQAMEKAGNAENETAEFSNQLDDAKNTISEMQARSGSYAEELEVDSKGLVYLLNNGQRIAGPYGPFAGGGGGTGGGSTGGNAATLTVSNDTGWLSRTIAKGAECAVKFTWSSIEDEMQTGDGTAKVAVNGAVKTILNIKQGQVTIDLSKYVATGSNVVKVTISDVYDNNRTISFSVQVLDLSISSSFDTTTPYTGAILFPYTPTGNIKKTIHFILDGKEIGTETTSVSGRQMSYTIRQQSHGTHTFDCYFDCDINGDTVKSNTLHFEIMCLEALNNTPIIASSFAETSVSQYTTLHVNYTVYDPANIKAPVTIKVNDNVVANLTVDRTEQTFTWRADDVGTLTIVISSGSVSKTITLTVTESDINVQAETDQLKLYLTSTGRANTEKNPLEWKSGSIAAKLTGFNLTSDGWQNDDDGVTVLRVAGDARVEIPYQIFATDFRGTGKTIEIEFATRNVRNYDAKILSCMSDGRGLEMTAQQASLKSEQSELTMQYKEDDHVRLSFVIEKQSEHRLMYVYVNGVMSGAVQYPTSDDFAQKTPVGISIGADDCTTDIYCIRVYDNDLNRVQILDNWLADTQDVTALLERYQRCNVYDDYGNITIQTLPSDLPYMIITCPELPQYKGDKKTVDITYIDPVSASRSFTASGVQADVQGTSSQYYPRKNYKLKYKNGFEMTQSGTHVAKYPLRPGAIETSTFTMKADVASSEGCNNTELVRLYNDSCVYKTPPQKADSKIRQGIDGFPIVIFWNDGTNTTFIGKYNWNNDKGTEEIYGFKDGDESWEILNNTSDRVLWKSDDFESMGTDENGNSVPAWLGDFEARYPDEDPAYTDSTQLKAFASFVKSTDRTQATNATLPEPVTYDGVTYTSDSADYRLAKFKAEIGKYTELQSAEFYYLFTELFLMVDSRAKNAFPSFFGSEVTA